MTRTRAIGSAMLLFVGMTGSLGGLGALVFEETALALYGAGITAGAAWLSLGTYRAETAAQDAKSAPSES